MCDLASGAAQFTRKCIFSPHRNENSPHERTKCYSRSPLAATMASHTMFICYTSVSGRCVVTPPPPIHIPYVFQHWLCAAASASAVIAAADDDDGRCHTIAIPACLPYNKTGQKLLFYDGLTGCESAFPFGRDNRVQAKNYSVSRVYLVHQKA